MNIATLHICIANEFVAPCSEYKDTAMNLTTTAQCAVGGLYKIDAVQCLVWQRNVCNMSRLVSSTPPFLRKWVQPELSAGCGLAPALIVWAGQMGVRYRANVPWRGGGAASSWGRRVGGSSLDSKVPSLCVRRSSRCVGETAETWALGSPATLYLMPG